MRWLHRNPLTDGALLVRGFLSVASQAATLLVLAAVLAAAAPVIAQDRAQAPFEFGLFGDMPYNEVGYQLVPNLVASMNGENLAFVIHDGDIKSGSTLCDDATFQWNLELFASSRHPLIYTPGDNEWTDCHRENNGPYDPLERLAKLRSMFFTDANSAGQRKISLERQSSVPGYEKFVENTRWSLGDVTFVTLHIIGSNNNLGRTDEQDVEYRERNAANLAWLAASFTAARNQGSRGVLLAIQANVFDGPVEQRTGFADFLAALESETVVLGKPVVLVHGDSHYFRIDKPLISRHNGRRIENFTRVETFGEFDVHWVRGRVDHRDPNLFSFTQALVPANLEAHAP
jgi:hypothetical protein